MVSVNGKRESPFVNQPFSHKIIDMAAFGIRCGKPERLGVGVFDCLSCEHAPTVKRIQKSARDFIPFPSKGGHLGHEATFVLEAVVDQ